MLFISSNPLVVDFIYLSIVLGRFQEKIKTKCSGPQEIVDYLQLTNISHYDGRTRPSRRPVIKVGVRIQVISGVNDSSQNFALEALVAQSWRDKRLNYQAANPCTNRVSIPHRLYGHLWSPDICFMNTKEAVIHESPFKNLYAMIFNFGMVWTEFRTTLKGEMQRDVMAGTLRILGFFSCGFRFANFGLL